MHVLGKNKQEEKRKVNIHLFLVQFFLALIVWFVYFQFFLGILLQVFFHPCLLNNESNFVLHSTLCSSFLWVFVCFSPPPPFLYIYFFKDCVPLSFCTFGVLFSLVLCWAPLTSVIFLSFQCFFWSVFWIVF